MTNINWKDVAIRAGKTFVQAFISALLVSISGLAEVNIGDKKAFATVLVSTIVGATAAGVSAAWNIVKPIFEVKDDGEKQ